MNYSGDHSSRFSAEGLYTGPDVGPVHLDREKGQIGHSGVDAITIPDAHLLFSGDYKRVGLDLVLSDETQRYVVRDYFKGDKHASLRSTDGANLSAAVVNALTGYTVYAQAAPDATGGQVIGHVLKASGTATAIRNGVTVVLNIGDAVLKGDVIQTGSDSSVGITFIDGSAFGMSSDARMVLNEMVFDPGGSSNSSLISLVQGTITFVAGQTAKNGNMRVETPVATMGIRGTAVLVEIGANNGPTKFSVLVEPDGTTGSYNLYDNSNGQLIGTISQAGTVTLVTSNGTDPASASQYAKSQADQQQEKALVQQVFQLYFPGFVPDGDAKPNSNKSGANGSSTNNLAGGPVTEKYQSGSSLGLLTIQVTTTTVDPKTGQTTTTSIVYTNTPAIFSTTPATGGQNFVAPNDGFNIADHVKIIDPDIGNAPFFDVATPFVSGTANFTNATSSIPLPNGFDLFSLVHIDQTTGHVSYTPQTFNFLDDGQTVVYKLEFYSRSGPDTALLSLLFTVTGANDAPVFTVTPVAGNVAEIGDQTQAAPQTGQTTIISTPVTIGFTDPDFTDLGANYHVAVTNVSSNGSTAGLPQGATALKNALLSYFNFAATPVTKNLDQTTGHIDGTFAATDKTFDYLADGQQLVITYTVQITDPENASAVLTKDFTVTVTGSNDAPMLTSDAGAIHQAAEVPNTTDAPTSVVDSTSGSLTFTDADLTDTHTVSAALNSGANAVVWSGGNYSDIPAATRAALASGMSAMVTTDSTNAASGSVNWNFSLEDRLFDFLGHTETLTLIYDITVKDYNNGVDEDTSSTQQIVVQVTASNDRPVITAVDVIGAVKEDVSVQSGNLLKDTGSVTFADADETDQETASIAFAGDSTTSGAGISAPLHAALQNALSLQASSFASHTGTINWNFALDNALVQYLAEGETVTATYTITVQDNSGVAASNTSAPQTVTVTITGTNDAPTITSNAAAATAAFTELATTTGSSASDSVNGTIGFADVDIDDTHTLAQSASIFTWSGGSLSQTQIDALNAAATSSLTKHDSTGTGSGSVDWAYALTDSALDFLSAGETLTVTYDVTVTDNSGTSNNSATQQVTITFSGANDVPSVAAISGVALTEQTDTSILHQAITANFTDVDLTDIGQTASVQKVVVTGVVPPGVTASADINSGSLYSLLTAGSVSKASGSSSGTASFSFDAASTVFDYLAANETITLTYTVAVTDAAATAGTQTVAITITGTNDAPIVTTTSNAFSEQAGTANTGNDTATGTISFTDVDLSDRPTVSAAFASYTYFAANGTTALTLTSAQATAIETALALVPATNTNNGSAAWTYTVADSALDFLAANETLTLTYNASVNDGHGGVVTQPLTVTITGTNDAPVVTTTSAVFSEQAGTANTGNDTATGTIGFTDVDLSDRPTVSAAFASYTYFAANGTMALTLTSAQATAIETALALVPATNTNNGSAAWTYTVADSALDFLAANETLTLTYNATVNDGHGGVVTQPLTVTITGTNDAPAITQGPETASVADGGTSFVTGQFFTATDPDHVDTQTWTIEGGSRVASGAFQFAIDELKVTKVMSNVNTTIFDDSFSGTAPPSGPNFLVGGTPAGGPYNVSGGNFVADAANGLADIDSDQAKFVGLSASSNTNGQAVFGEFATLLTNISSTSPAAGLRSGETFAVSGLFSNVSPADANNEAYGIRLTDRLNGATIAAGNPLDQPGTQNVQLSIVKMSDGTTAVQFNQIDFTTNLSTVLGTWTVDPNYASDEIKLTLSHNASANGQVHASVSLVNAGTGTVDETYNFSPTGQIFANEDWTRVSFFGRSIATTSTAPTADSALAGTYGTLDIDQTGHWSYALNNGLAATKALAAGETEQDVFHVDVTDASGATSTQTVTVNVTGINDAPTFSGSAISGAGSGYTENGAPVGIVASAPLIVSDVDNTNFNGGYLSAAVTAGGHAGDTLSVGTTSHIMLNTDGVTVLFDADGSGPAASFVAIGTLTTSGSSLSIALNSAADAAAIMELTTAIQFSSTSDNPTADQRTVTFTLNDGSGTANGGHDTTSFSVPLTVTPVNDAPAVSAPSSISATENTPYAITGISVSDVDDNGGTEQITLSVGHGTLMLVSNSGVTVDQTDDGSAGTLSFTGTIDALNAALTDGVTYTAASNYSGTDTLHVAIDDQGNTGSGGALTATQDVGIDVAPAADGAMTQQNHAPVLTDIQLTTTGPSAVYQLIGDHYSNADGNGLNGIAISHVDANPVTQGQWEYQAFHGWIAIDPGTVSDDHALAIEYGASLKFVPVSGYTGTPSLTVYALDADLGQSEGQDDVHISVSSHGGSSHISDPATISAPTGYAPPELDATSATASPVSTRDTTFTGLSVSDSSGSGNLSISVDAGYGTVVFAGATTGLTVGTDTSGGATASGSVSDIQAALSSGVTYHSDGTTATDQLTLTATDQGASTVNFVFAQPGQSGATLTGTTGNDVFFATSQNETFVFNTTANQTFGHDIITNFAPGTQDLLQFSASTFADAATALAHTADVNGHAVVTDTMGNSVALVGVTTAQLHQNDFHIVI